MRAAGAMGETACAMGENACTLQVPWVRLQLGIDPDGVPGGSRGTDSQPAPKPELGPCARHVLLVLLQVRSGSSRSGSSSSSTGNEEAAAAAQGM